MSGITFFITLVIVGVLAGIVSAAAGLASLISYPALLMMGLPPVMANVTSAWSTGVLIVRLRPRLRSYGMISGKCG